VPSLIESLRETPPAVKCASATALGKLGPAAREAIPCLINLLKDGDPWVRSASASALGHLGPVAKSAIPSLYSLLEGKAGRRDPHLVVAIVRLDPDGRDQADRLLRSSDDLFFRAVVLSALGRASVEGEAFVREYLGSADAASVQEQYGGSLAKRLEAANRFFDDLECLAPSAGAAEPLLRKLLNHRDLYVRQRAERSLRLIEGTDRTN
jgi:HEAT repeat protein